MYSRFYRVDTSHVLAQVLCDIVDRGADFHHPMDSMNRVDTPFARGSYASFMFETRPFRWDHIDLERSDNTRFEMDDVR